MERKGGVEMTEQELRSRLENLAGEIPAETHRAFLSAASPGKEAKKASGCLKTLARIQFMQ